MARGPDPSEIDEPGDQGYARPGRVFLEPGLEVTEVRVPLLSDERERARQLAERNGWDAREADHIVYSRGLVALERETEGPSGLEGKRLLDMRTPEERERFLFTRLNDLESKYSVMKFTAFGALRDNETLRMNVTGLTTEYQALVEQNKYLRTREDDLRARASELEGLVGELTARVHDMLRAPGSRWERIKELVRTVFA